MAGHAQDDERFACRNLNKTFESIAEEDALMGSQVDSFPETLVDTAAPPAASAELVEQRELEHEQAPSRDHIDQDWFGFPAMFVG